VLRDKPGSDGKPKLKIASRGFNPSRGELSSADDFADALERELFVDVPNLWREGGEALVNEDQTYIGLGAAAVSPKTWAYCGYWKTARRELRLNSMSVKRTAPHGAKARERRASSLVDLGVTPYTVNPALGLTGLLDESAPSIPNWANVESPRPKRGRRIEDADDGADDKNVNAGLDSGDGDDLF
jgi:hypothetical protein